MTMFRPLFTIALVLALVTAAAAQTTTVSGTVIDQAGAAVPGASVTLTGPAATASAVTGSRGEYSFPGVGAGTYRISVTLPGFATAMQEGVVVGPSNVE